MHKYLIIILLAQLVCYINAFGGCMDDYQLNGELVYFSDIDSKAKIDVIRTPESFTKKMAIQTNETCSPKNYLCKPYHGRYTPHFNIKTVVHYVGQPPHEQFPASPASAWDKDWVGSMGGIDYPELESRSRLQPIGFKPKMNLFYCALPYNDLDKWGRKSSAAHVPWAGDLTTLDSSISIMQGKWVHLMTNQIEAYCQIEDVGPHTDDDFDYVFGPPHRVPERGQGLGISPAVAEYLGVIESIEIKDITLTWAFIESEDVPHGPWDFVPTPEQPILRKKK